CVGTLQPRKDVARLVRGFARWRRESGRADVGLVLAGQQGWLFDPRWTEGVEGVHLTGYVDDADVAALYSGALALVFPSLHEGFGFPVLEAMRCGTPVITSATSSLPEVAGPAALLVNPRDVGAIAVGIEQIMSDSALRDNLIARGFAQAGRFTWRRAAEQALEAMEMAAHSSSC